MPMLRFRHQLATAAVAACATLPSAAWACCDDFWSCAGAVASGGLTCVLEETKKAADKLLRDARDAQNRIRQDYQNSRNDMNNRVNQSRSDANNSVQNAVQKTAAATAKTQNLARVPVVALNTSAGAMAGAVAAAAAATQGKPAGPVPQSITSGANIATLPRTVAGAGGDPQQAPAPAQALGALAAGGAQMRIELPADPQDVRNILQRAAERTAALEREIQAKQVPSIAANLRTLDSTLIDGLRNLDNLIQQLVFGPIEGILNTLAKADPTGLTSLIGAATTGLDNALTALSGQIFSSMQALDQALLGTIGQVEAQVNQALGLGNAAELIAKLAQDLSQDKTQKNLKALEQVLPPDPLASVLRASAAGAMVPAAALTRPVALSGSAERMRSTLMPLSQSFKNRPPQMSMRPDITPYRMKTDGLIDGQYRGLNAAQAEAKRSELLAEARRRFASDPQTLAEAERLLNNGAQRSAMLRPATQLITPAVNAAPAINAPATTPPVLNQAARPALPASAMQQPMVRPVLPGAPPAFGIQR